jgi:hypothetical protein
MPDVFSGNTFSFPKRNIGIVAVSAVIIQGKNSRDNFHILRTDHD